MKPSLSYSFGGLFALGLVMSGLSTQTFSATVTSLSDDFEGEAKTTNYTAFANWTVSGGTVDTVGPRGCSDDNRQLRPRNLRPQF